MPSCVVKSCHNNSSKVNKNQGVTFHRFPTNSETKNKWIATIRQSRDELHWLPSKTSVVCSDHFDDEDLYMTDRGLRRVIRCACPTKNLHINCSEDQPHSYVEFPVLLKDIKQEKQSTEYEISVVEITPMTKAPVASDDSLDSVYDSPKKATMRKQLMKKTLLQVEHIKKIKQLHQKIRRLKTKNSLLQQKTRRKKVKASLQQILVNLRKEKYINNDVFNILEEHVSAAELCNKLLKKSRKNKLIPVPQYTPEFKKFCVTLNFYSSQAYSYVLKAFNSCLPDAVITYNWYRNDNGSPGLTEEALEFLKLKVQSTEGKLLCALVADETFLQPQKLNSCDGTLDFGAGPSKSGLSATEACTFVLVCLNGYWQIPLGYFLVHGLNGSQKKNLINMCLTKCEHVGVKVISLTLDANATSISAAQLLECRINDPENMKTTFKHPAADYEVALFFDPSNMLRLIRDHFQNKKKLLDQNQNKVNWAFLAKLKDLQEKQGSVKVEDEIGLRNALKEVNPSDDFLSRNMADALKFCREDASIDDFKDSEGTEKFITIMSDLFDIFNSKWLTEEGFRRPLSSANKQDIFDYLEKSKKYILNMQISDAKIRKWNSVRSVTQKERCDEQNHVAESSIGYKGMLVCFESLKHLFSTLVESTRETDHIPTYRLTLEPLKNFFWLVKLKAGENIDYPTALQFMDGYRHQLVSMKLIVESTSCAPMEN